jgi:hypothetical protein
MGIGIGIGIGVGKSGVAPVSGLWTPDDTGLQVYFDLRQTEYTTDVGIDNITNGGSIGGAFAQATGSLQPALDETLGSAGAPCAQFDGADDYLDSSAAASAWAFLHDNTTDWTLLLVYKDEPDADGGAVVGTARGNAADIGIRLQRAGNSLQLAISNSTATYEFTGSAVISTGDKVLSLRYTAGSPGVVELRVNGGTPVPGLSGNTNGTPSAANPNATMRLGAQVIVNSPRSTSGIGLQAIWSRRLSDAQLFAAVDQLLAEYQL